MPQITLKPHYILLGISEEEKSGSGLIMKDVMIYKEYIGSVHYSTEDEIFYGKIEDINDSISYEGSSVSELKSAFEEAVEDYLELCNLNG